MTQVWFGSKFKDKIFTYIANRYELYSIQGHPPTSLRNEFKESVRDLRGQHYCKLGKRAAIKTLVVWVI